MIKMPWARIYRPSFGLVFVKTGSIKSVTGLRGVVWQKYKAWERFVNRISQNIGTKIKSINIVKPTDSGLTQTKLYRILYKMHYVPI